MPWQSSPQQIPPAARLSCPAQGQDSSLQFTALSSRVCPNWKKKIEKFNLVAVNFDVGTYTECIKILCYLLCEFLVASGSFQCVFGRKKEALVDFW